MSIDCGADGTNGEEREREIGRGVGAFLGFNIFHLVFVHMYRYEFGIDLVCMM